MRKKIPGEQAKLSKTQQFSNSIDSGQQITPIYNIPIEQTVYSHQKEKKITEDLEDRTITIVEKRIYHHEATTLSYRNQLPPTYCSFYSHIRLLVIIYGPFKPK